MIATAAALFVYSALLLALAVPVLSFRRFGRRDASDGQIALDVPVLATCFALLGWFPTATISFVAHLIAAGRTREYRFHERLLAAIVRFPLWAGVGYAARFMHVRLTAATLPGFAESIGFTSLWALAFVLLWFDPFTAIRTRRPVRTFWLLHLRDPVLWFAIIAQAAWGYLCTIVTIDAGILFGLAALSPLPLLALILRALHRERLASHRLTLARDAVWNLLQSRDPGEQIASILQSVHGDAPSQTLQIYAALRSEDRPIPLASVGPEPDEDRTPLVRRALIELDARNRQSVGVRDDKSVITAYAIRSGRLLGSLIVHRDAGAPVRVPPRRYADVANEMAPLLRDVKSVVAAHTAAAFDSLTALPNRASIMRTLRDRLEDGSPGHDCAILLLDIDHFKAVNDALGHLAGDQCLRLVGQTIGQHVRAADRAGRIGGEEFIVVMPETNAALARTIGERVRDAVEHAGARHANGKPVTVSVGVAAATAGDTADTLIARADRALYRAKNGGRNRVEISA